MRVIQVSEQQIVSMHATGAMVFTASQGAEPKHAVALGFERCGAHVRDLLLQRIRHGAMPADDHLLTLVPRPCDVEMRQLLDDIPSIIKGGLLTEFVKTLPTLKLPAGELTLTLKEKAMRRLRSALGMA